MLQMARQDETNADSGPSPGVPPRGPSNYLREHARAKATGVPSPAGNDSPSRASVVLSEVPRAIDTLELLLNKRAQQRQLELEQQAEPEQPPTPASPAPASPAEQRTPGARGRELESSAFPSREANVPLQPDAMPDSSAVTAADGCASCHLSPSEPARSVDAPPWRSLAQQMKSLSHRMRSSGAALLEGRMQLRHFLDSDSDSDAAGSPRSPQDEFRAALLSDRPRMRDFLPSDSDEASDAREGSGGCERRDDDEGSDGCESRSGGSSLRRFFWDTVGGVELRVTPSGGVFVDKNRPAGPNGTVRTGVLFAADAPSRGVRVRGEGVGAGRLPPGIADETAELCEGNPGGEGGAVVGRETHGGGGALVEERAVGGTGLASGDTRLAGGDGTAQSDACAQSGAGLPLPLAEGGAARATAAARGAAARVGAREAAMRRAAGKDDAAGAMARASVDTTLAGSSGLGLLDGLVSSSSLDRVASILESRLDPLNMARDVDLRDCAADDVAERSGAAGSGHVPPANPTGERQVGVPPTAARTALTDAVQQEVWAAMAPPASAPGAEGSRPRAEARGGVRRRSAVGDAEFDVLSGGSSEEEEQDAYGWPGYAARVPRHSSEEEAVSPPRAAGWTGAYASTTDSAGVPWDASDGVAALSAFDGGWMGAGPCGAPEDPTGSALQDATRGEAVGTGRLAGEREGSGLCAADRREAAAQAVRQGRDGAHRADAPPRDTSPMQGTSMDTSPPAGRARPSSLVLPERGGCGGEAVEVGAGAGEQSSGWDDAQTSPADGCGGVDARRDSSRVGLDLRSPISSAAVLMKRVVGRLTGASPPGARLSPAAHSAPPSHGEASGQPSPRRASPIPSTPPSSATPSKARRRLMAAAEAHLSFSRWLCSSTDAVALADFFEPDAGTPVTAGQPEGRVRPAGAQLAQETTPTRGSGLHAAHPGAPALWREGSSEALREAEGPVRVRAGLPVGALPTPTAGGADCRSASNALGTVEQEGEGHSGSSAGDGSTSGRRDGGDVALGARAGDGAACENDCELDAPSAATVRNRAKKAKRKGKQKAAAASAGAARASPEHGERETTLASRGELESDCVRGPCESGVGTAEGAGEGAAGAGTSRLTSPAEGDGALLAAGVPADASPARVDAAMHTAADGADADGSWATIPKRKPRKAQGAGAVRSGREVAAGGGLPGLVPGEEAQATTGSDDCLAPTEATADEEEAHAQAAVEAAAAARVEVPALNVSDIDVGAADSGTLGAQAGAARPGGEQAAPAADDRPGALARAVDASPEDADSGDEGMPPLEADCNEDQQATPAWRGLGSVNAAQREELGGLFSDEELAASYSAAFAAQARDTWVTVGKKGRGKRAGSGSQGPLVAAAEPLSLPRGDSGDSGGGWKWEQQRPALLAAEGSAVAALPTHKPAKRLAAAAPLHAAVGATLGGTGGGRGAATVGTGSACPPPHTPGAHERLSDEASRAAPTVVVPKAGADAARPSRSKRAVPPSAPEPTPPAPADVARPPPVAPAARALASPPPPTHAPSGDGAGCAAQARPACRFWPGRCKSGARCRFAHARPDIAPSARPKVLGLPVPQLTPVSVTERCDFPDPLAATRPAAAAPECAQARPLDASPSSDAGTPRHAPRGGQTPHTMAQADADRLAAAQLVPLAQPDLQRNASEADVQPAVPPSDLEATTPPHPAPQQAKAEPVQEESPSAALPNGTAPALTGGTAPLRAEAVASCADRMVRVVECNDPDRAQTVSQGHRKEVAVAPNRSEKSAALIGAAAGDAILKSLGLGARPEASAAADGHGASPWGDEMEAIVRERWRAALADPGLTTAHAWGLAIHTPDARRPSIA